MNQITLHAEGISDVTIVPNAFIDRFMPSANGAYVKVYLYLLRCFLGNCQEVTISSIADRLENTEKDIIRALTYWEKMNLLTLSRNVQKEITAVHLVDINHIQSEQKVITDLDTELDEIAVSIHTQTKPAGRKSYSAEKIAELTNNDEIKWAMHIVEIYLDRPLKPMDLQLILYLYEELHFSAELIMYLYEYCVSKGKKNASYIEAVALTWAEEGIDTEEKAKEAATTYNDHFNCVNKAFGLNRAPGQIERQYITKWVEVFGFSDEIITEACNRTILRTQKPDFKYTDKILETWFKKDVKSQTDIVRLDEEFSKGNKANDTNKVTSMIKPAANKFNQFPQRTYTAKDYAELERKLLNKGL
jgi:DnaD/phage-associated family protein